MENKTKLYEEDIGMLLYFWKEKGDPTHCFTWDSKKDLIKEQFPEIVRAIDNWKSAERTLTAVLNHVMDMGDLPLETEE